MSTHTRHPIRQTHYFVTFTCYRWLHLFEESQVYDYFPDWFTKLKYKGCHLNGYVIMPNHLHMVVYQEDTDRDLNQIISESKRFLAYEVVRRLKSLGKHDLLSLLEQGVQANERKKGKKHQVFRLSFDGQVLKGPDEIERVLDYIHHNPVNGLWNLADDFLAYPHSSAGFYELDRPGQISITHYKSITTG